MFSRVKRCSMFMVTQSKGRGRIDSTKLRLTASSGLAETDIYRVHKNEWTHQTTIEAIANLARRDDNSSHQQRDLFGKDIEAQDVASLLRFTGQHGDPTQSQTRSTYRSGPQWSRHHRFPDCGFSPHRSVGYQNHHSSHQVVHHGQ